MKKRPDVDIRITLMNILIVTGLLLSLGSLNLIISRGLMKDIVIWGIIGISTVVLSISARILYNKYKIKKKDEIKTEADYIKEKSE